MSPPSALVLLTDFTTEMASNCLSSALSLVNLTEVVRTSSLDELALSSAPVAEVTTPNTVEEKREVALKEIDERRQMLNDTKAWIQNGLMTVVGVGVLTYLQTLESSM